MFKEDSPPIVTLAQSGPLGFLAIYTMVSASIRQPWHTAGYNLSRLAMVGFSAEWLNLAPKREGLSYVRANLAALYDVAMTASTVEALAALTYIPGLSLPKAGFVLQLCRGASAPEVGCIDVHNIRRLGLGKLNTNTANLSHPARLRKAEEYCNVITNAGGSEQLWNDWCVYLSTQTPNAWRYDDAGEGASALHRFFLDLGPKPAPELVNFGPKPKKPRQR